MEKEAECAAASAEMAAARREAQQANIRGSMLEAELKSKVNDTERLVREHGLRRVKMLVRITSSVTKKEYQGLTRASAFDTCCRTMMAQRISVPH